MAQQVERVRSRLCQKSLDGAAAVQVMLLQQAVGRGHVETVEVASDLLRYGFPVTDVQRMCGLNRTTLRRLSAQLGRDPSERAGRIPARMRLFLETTSNHLWGSVFLARLEQFRRHWPAENTTFVSGRTMLAAIRATELACGPLSPQMGAAKVRYLMLAAERLCAGEARLRGCARCGTQCMVLDQLESIGNRLASGSACPTCAETRRDSSHGARRRSATAVTTFAAADLHTHGDAEASRAAFDALLA